MNMISVIRTGILYLLSIIIGPACFTSVIGPKDYCEHEKFEPQCRSNQAVVMKSATYGRMKVGGCISIDYGIGCSMDVLPVMDDLCSGLSSCSVPTIDSSLLSAKIKAKSCPSLSAYLTASYSCQDVIHSPDGACQRGPIEVHNKEGYLSSAYAADSGNGGPSCPWRLKSSGNIMNITLVKFPKLSDDSLLSSSSSLCYELGRIKEGREERNMMVCGTDLRHKTVYVSHGGDVEISFTEKAVLDTLGRFLISFQASSCDVPRDLSNMYAVQKGNTVLIHCNFTERNWKVKCGEVDRWKNENHECPSNTKWDLDIDDIFPHESISVGIVVTVALGLTVGICAIGFVMYIIYYYCKRCKESFAHQRAAETKDYTDEEKKGTENLIKFPPENENVKYRENTLRSNAGSSDTSSLDKRTISWPIRESFRHSSHADTLQFPDEHESESVSVEDETINSHVASEEVAIDCPDYGLPKKS